MKSKECKICGKIIHGVSSGALDTYFEKHMRTHKLRRQKSKSKLT